MPRISIDPGITGTGYAVWRDGSDEIWQSAVPPMAHGIITARTRPLDASSKHWLERAKSIVRQFEQLCFAWHPTIVYIEGPKPFQDNATSNASMNRTRKDTAGNSDEATDLFKLVYLCGMLVHATWQAEASAKIIPVNTWKGQLPKAVIDQRVKAILGEGAAGISSHAMDATGIGLFCKGLLNCGNTEANENRRFVKTTDPAKRKLEQMRALSIGRNSE